MILKHLHIYIDIYIMDQLLNSTNTDLNFLNCQQFKSHSELQQSKHQKLGMLQLCKSKQQVILLVYPCLEKSILYFIIFKNLSYVVTELHIWRVLLSRVSQHPRNKEIILGLTLLIHIRMGFIESKLFNIQINSPM